MRPKTLALAGVVFAVGPVALSFYLGLDSTIRIVGGLLCLVVAAFWEISERGGVGSRFQYAECSNCDARNIAKRDACKYCGTVINEDG